MNSEIVCKIVILSIVILFIIVTVIKRFFYFKPSNKFLPTTENYTAIKHRHIYGWLLKSDSEKIVIFCHGYNGNISYRENKYIELKKIGCSVLTFDYSGYGKSSGIPSEQQLYEDASSIVSMISKNYDPKNIIVYGESMGGPVAIYIARRFSLPKVILESPLVSMKLYVENLCFLFKSISFLFNDFDIKKYMLGYKGKILLLHSTDDKVIPYKHVENILYLVTKHKVMTGIHRNANIPWQDVKEFIFQ